MQLRSPDENERADIRALLADNDLPVEDFDTATINFIVAVESGRIVGVAGLEIFADAGLLRSLAVDSSRRGSGTGVALVQAVEAQARERKLSQLVLLTQTAEGFFSRRGYDVIARNSAPASVQTSGEFREICPASAICMSKSLAQ